MGIELHETLKERTSARVIEVYPHSAFCELAGEHRLPKKTTAEGVHKRTELLRQAGVDDRWLDMWSHDALDAAAAAVVAFDCAQQTAQRAECSARDDCGRDGSSIWLPEPPSTPSAARTSRPEATARQPPRRNDC